MRVLSIVVVALAGCASSAELSQSANLHMQRANGAAATNNYAQARVEQRKAEKLYQKAVARAYEEERLPPPPPSTPPPLPVFDPQLQR